MGTYLSVRNKGDASAPDNFLRLTKLSVHTFGCKHLIAAVEEEQRRSWVENVLKDMVTSAK